jgi:hypothetical protein
MQKRKISKSLPMPGLHMMLLLVCTLLTIIALIAYIFVPESKAGQFIFLIGWGTGMIGGKLSNGFGKPGGGAFEHRQETEEIEVNEDGG